MHPENRTKGNDMKIKKWFSWNIIFALGVLAVPAALYGQGQYWDFPPLPAAHEYGDLLIDRLSTKNQVKPVFFSHWSHRLRYSCRVCHWELDFAFIAGGTEMNEEDNRNGLFCGKCHDGVQVFGHTDDNCQRCHTGKKESDPDRFVELTGALQRSKYGNKINWGAAVKSGRLAPAYSIFKPNEEPLDFRKRLELKAEWPYVPPAYFPHDVHVKWLDCNNCHPDIFNIKKKGTEHFMMKYILDDKFCGVCHLRVAFPLNNCTRCHPAIKTQ